MTLYQGFDLSGAKGDPIPSQPYTGARWVAGYIGGFTPHVWALSEWNRMISGPGGTLLRSLPIWVSDFSGSPIVQARSAVRAALALGWQANRTPRRFICLDSEVSENVAFIHDFANEVHADGFDCLDYRSEFPISVAPSGLPEWVAHYNVPPGPFTDLAIAFQYKADVPFGGTQIDLDVCSSLCFEQLGRGLRRAVAA